MRSKTLLILLSLCSAVLSSAYRPDLNRLLDSSAPNSSTPHTEPIPNNNSQSTGSECPYYGNYTVNSGGSTSFTIPWPAGRISTGTTCVWAVANPSGAILLFAVQRLSLDDRLTATAAGETLSDTELRSNSTYMTRNSLVTFSYSVVATISGPATYIAVTVRQSTEEPTSTTGLATIIILVLVCILGLALVLAVAKLFVTRCRAALAVTAAGAQSAVRSELVHKILTLSTEQPYKDSLNKYNQPYCCVCLGPFSSAEPVRVLECQHVFHSKCLQELFEHSITPGDLRCPNCNLVLKANYGEPEANHAAAP